MYPLPQMPCTIWREIGSWVQKDPVIAQELKTGELQPISLMN